MTAYDDLRTEISAQYSDLSNRLQQVARFALDNPDAMALETIAEIARRASVQPSTMIRFAKAFGFDGFSDMQRLFRSHLVDRTPRYRERIHDLQANGDQSLKTADGILTHFVESGVNALRHLCEEIPAERLERAIRLLKLGRTIHVAGQRRSFAVASYLAYGFWQLGLSCQLADNVGGMFEQQTQQLGKGDVLVAVSFQPYAAETLCVAERAAQQGVPVIAITDAALSPLRPLAAVSFEIEEASVKGFRSLSATMGLAAALVVSLGQSLETQTARGKGRRRPVPAETGALD
jgi:DNA-binding MurR/RpiR family transcriptional regulator